MVPLQNDDTLRCKRSLAGNEGHAMNDKFVYSKETGFPSLMSLDDPRLPMTTSARAIYKPLIDKIRDRELREKALFALNGGDRLTVEELLKVGIGEAFDVESKISKLLDDDVFQKIVRQMASFNLFEAMGFVRRELAHSNFLGFLLSPACSHGFGVAPLLVVLRAILNNMPVQLRPVRALELALADLDTAVVLREWRNIDLLIEIRDLKLIVLIENKIDGKAGEDQLARYRNIVTSEYRDFRYLLVYLTPDGADPDETGFVALSYFDLAKAVEGLLQEGKGSSIADSNVIVRHYVEMLRRYVVQDEELQSHARKLYERHKEAFDFIFKSRPEPENLLNVVSAFLEKQPDLTQDHRSATILRFARVDWANVTGLNCRVPNLWMKTTRNLLVEVRRGGTGEGSDRIVLYLVSGPTTDAKIHERIFEGAKARPDLFKGLSKSMGKTQTTIYKRDLLTVAAAEAMDNEEKATAIEDALSAFLKDEFPYLSAAIIETLGTTQ